ncbi:hypothetical protein ACSBR2_020201 [Camellia fascicularis]
MQEEREQSNARRLTVSSNMEETEMCFILLKDVFRQICKTHVNSFFSVAVGVGIGDCD